MSKKKTASPSRPVAAKDEDKSAVKKAAVKSSAAAKKGAVPGILSPKLPALSPAKIFRKGTTNVPVTDQGLKDDPLVITIELVIKDTATLDAVNQFLKEQDANIPAVGLKIQHN